MPHLPVARSPRLAQTAIRVLCAVAFLLADPTGGIANAEPGRPQTIPALREWAPAPGAFQVSGGSRILVRTPALLADAEVFADDLRELLGHPVPVVNDAAAIAADGDISLALGELDGRLGSEGYRLRIGNAIEITAIESAGAFYGTRTVLQLLHQGSAIPAGEALDWPRYPERGLMVDAGRKYFTPGWIAGHLKELAYLKMNYFHLHFSDNEGWRIESTVHPEIVSARHLTKAEVSELVALAARYHIIVVPEIDMPGHMGAALAPHPEFQLTDSQDQKAPRNLDVTNPLAVKFARELIEEYLPLFPARYWHSGGEEYLAERDYANYPQLEAHAREQYGPNATGRDAVIGFMNWVNDLVRSHGRTDRIWHDGISGGSAVTANPNMVVEWWTDFNPLGDPLPPDPQVFLDRGHVIMNASYWPLYYTVGSAAGFPEGLPPRVDPCSFYQEWAVNQFHGALNAPAVACQTVHLTPTKLVAADEPRNLGAKLHVWTDTPDAETQDEIAAGIAPRLRIVAQKTWESPPLTPYYAGFEPIYAGFEPIMEAVGHAPGYPIPPPPEVGFWAQQNASATDPAVLDVLEDTGGSLYLLINYLADYGPPGVPPTSTFARDATLAANRRGIAVNAWIIVPVEDGIFAHENNAVVMQQAVQAFPSWASENGLHFREIVFDLEFPVGNGAVFDVFGGDPNALADLMRANIDPVHQCEAVVTYRDTISWAHQRGIRMTGAPAPFFLDDLADGNIALQDALDGVAFPPLGYDALYLQAYRTYSNPGPGYVAQFFRDMQSQFGAAGQVTIGDTQQGPPYDVLENLVDDVRMLAGMGATRIPIFELGGTVNRFGTAGLRAIIEAARDPMSATELAVAGVEQPYDREQRDFFKQLDQVAVAETAVVTAPPGAPDGPNAYPDGCGDPYALPEPAAGLVWLGAIPLLAGLRARRASRAR